MTAPDFTPIFYPAGTRVFSSVTFNVSLSPGNDPGGVSPLLWTEAYEIRNRNSPAFRFRPLTPTVGTKKFDAKLYVSQGPVDGKETWTPAPMTLLRATPLVDQTLAVIDVYGGTTNLPPQYGSTLVIISKSYAGPYNYAKFLLTPEGETDYSGSTLEIIANAREL
jgi:hypothetical protein